ncbi:carboxymuconolactone decarboxylase family protein [Actinomadura terrae]|uniref:carboxymuconolactone decarboxylase family protein n=1 Tax=Actinomadura terrae TaxID=604353 RepID=UPI001FA71AB5|nr:carboxymuconolactone decarboxylase family protein [Actinomadura terrae]
MTTENDLKSRLPDITPQLPELGKLSASLRAAIQRGPVPESTMTLMMLRAAQIVGSTYHAIMLTDTLREAGETEHRITAVATWQDAPYFTEAERLALELVEAVLTPNPSGERVSDDLFARVAALYSDEEIWMLTLTISHFSLFTPIALIAKPIPGRPIGKNYTN